MGIRAILAKNYSDRIWQYILVNDPLFIISAIGNEHKINRRPKPLPGIIFTSAFIKCKGFPIGNTLAILELFTKKEATLTSLGIVRGCNIVFIQMNNDLCLSSLITVQKQQ